MAIPEKIERAILAYKHAVRYAPDMEKAARAALVQAVEAEIAELERQRDSATEAERDRLAAALAQAEAARVHLHKRAMDVITSSSRISGAGWHVPAAEMSDLEVVVNFFIKEKRNV